SGTSRSAPGKSDAHALRTRGCQCLQCPICSIFPAGLPKITCGELTPDLLGSTIGRVRQSPIQGDGVRDVGQLLSAPPLFARLRLSSGGRRAVTPERWSTSPSVRPPCFPPLLTSSNCHARASPR